MSHLIHFVANLSVMDKYVGLKTELDTVEIQISSVQILNHLNFTFYSNLVLLLSYFNSLSNNFLILYVSIPTSCYLWRRFLEFFQWKNSPKLAIYRRFLEGSKVWTPNFCTKFNHLKYFYNDMLRIIWKRRNLENCKHSSFLLLTKLSFKSIMEFRNLKITIKKTTSAINVFKHL